MMRCRHLSKSGLRRPVFDLDVAGIPPDWEGATAPGGDTRDEPRRWQRCRRTTAKKTHFERVGPRAVLPAVQGCHAKPAEAAMDEDVVEDDTQGLL